MPLLFVFQETDENAKPGVHLKVKKEIKLEDTPNAEVVF